MKFAVLALDYDGTIAEAGTLDPAVRTAIVEARTRGIVVVLVTGRILADLQRRLREPSLFEAIVAENGALLYFPGTGRSLALGRHPPQVFLDELRRRNVSFLAGECVVEVEAATAPTVLAAIRELELPLALSFNRGRLMVLPQAISKGTGLREALRALRLSAHNSVGIGDAENDHELLETCELGVAVGWGSDALKAVADEVLEGEGPPAIADFVRRLLQETRLPSGRIGRRRLHLGIGEGGEPLSLAMGGRNVLIAGDTLSGKSWVAGLLCEQLVLHRYCVCVIDPEGDYGSLESLPGVVVMMPRNGVLDLDDVERTLRYPDVSLVVDLSRMGGEPKRACVRDLLAHLRDLRRRTGLPHRIVVDEAHYFLHEPGVTDLLDLELAGYTLITYQLSQLAPEVLASAESILVTRESDPAEARALHELRGRAWSEAEWARILGDLRLDQAALLPGSDESRERLVRFQLAGRLTGHVRHKHKYLNVPLPPWHVFVFTRGGQPTGREARTLQDFVEILTRGSTEEFDEHLKRQDFSRWIKSVFADQELAERVAEIEGAWAAGRMSGPRAAVIEVIRERYRERAEG
ncbi:MAG TPA: HAD hydrolase family protein [Planctomycetota bacterium]|nr:HAD hydrolase family protein [Planctomycetota bacterium]